MSHDRKNDPRDGYVADSQDSRIPLDLTLQDLKLTPLEQLHIKFPFLPINPINTACNQVYLPVAGNSETMQVPGNAHMVRFKSTGNFFVSRMGAIKTLDDIQNGTAPLLNPEGWYLCAGVSSFSILADSDRCLVVGEFWISG